MSFTLVNIDYYYFLHSIRNMSYKHNEVTSQIEAFSTTWQSGSLQSENLTKILKYFRNACIGGPEIQKMIISNQQICNFIKLILSPSYSDKSKDESVEKFHQTYLLALQLIGNTCVQNEECQIIAWNRFGNDIIDSCLSQPLNKSIDTKLMIIYNIFRGGTSILDDCTAFKTITRIWAKVISEKYEDNCEFLHLFFEYFLVRCHTTVKLYTHCDSEESISFLDYIAAYIRNDNPNGIINQTLLQFISKEFKMKSDYILRNSSKSIDKAHPRVAYALLRVIASASGSKEYAHLYFTDHALFINVSSLLRCLVAVGKQSKNEFTPMSRLHEVAPASAISSNFEEELSFELKTLLVRSVANLLNKNKINQEYCVDTELLPTLLECTNMDARNPLVKEWSILAIRNACFECQRNQEIIFGLTQKEFVPNDVLAEISVDMSSLRIK